jgi:NAD(P)H-dependent FMN reductase
MTIKIVALGGSLSLQSTSLAALRVAFEGASQVGAEVELFDVRELELPMYAQNSASVPDVARTLHRGGGVNPWTGSVKRSQLPFRGAQ